MAIIQVEDLIEAGVHYGHRSSRWNPKMRPYIYGKRNLIHIIDLRETVRGLVRAFRFLSRVSAQGSLILFVGTKRQAQEAIIRESHRCHMPYVAERWIGGTFTNFRTIRDRLKKLEELERLIETRDILNYSKKRRATLLRELRKVHRNLSGIRTMNRLPGAMVVVDPGKEASAVKEARAMGIPTVGLIDTDSDPDTVDLAIPGNDDSIRSIDLILGRLADAILDGYNQLPREQVERLEIEFQRAHSHVKPEEAVEIIVKSAGGGAKEEAAAESAPPAPVETEADREQREDRRIADVLDATVQGTAIAVGGAPALAAPEPTAAQHEPVGADPTPQAEPEPDTTSATPAEPTEPTEPTAEVTAPSTEE